MAFAGGGGFGGAPTVGGFGAGGMSQERTTIERFGAAELSET